jgi:hypothetical protein
MRDEL